MKSQLFIRSHYSLLNGLMSVDDILSSANQKGYDTIALSDYRVMYGAIEFYKKAIKANIKPIFALEVDIEDYRAVLYARNNLGMQLLHRYTYKLSQNESLQKEDLQNVGDDIYIVFPSESGPFESALFETDDTQLKRRMESLKLDYDHFYIGMTHHESKFFNQSNKRLEMIANIYDVECIALNKTYYKEPEDHHAFRALRAIDTQKLLSDPSLTFAPDRDFISYEALNDLYPQAWIDNANKIAKTCHVTLMDLKTDLPEFENSHGMPNDVFLKSLSFAGMKRRLNTESLSQEYTARLNYELDTLINMGFVNYFLIVYDIIRFAKVKGINVGPGRGSSAGSLVAYSLGITDVDPLEYDLMFERFLNPERQSMPDIDIDFPDDKRDEVVQYAVSKYGTDHVAHIVAFGTLRARQSFRDCGRILNIPVYKMNQAAKLITASTLLENFKQNKRFALLLDSDEALRNAFELALKIEGTPRHITQHAAGIVMSKDKLLDVIPITAIDDTTNVTQYDMNYVEDLGLIKIDFLGIRNLSIIDRISKEVQRTEPDFSIHNIPMDNQAAFEMISKGETIGIFQLESSGMTNLLRKMKPKRFLDIVDTIALYRPGPMENIPQYLENRENPNNIDYYHEDLKEITQSTYGILIYQEQIMQVAQKFANFSLSQADILRRAMSDKDANALKSLELEFKKGAKSLGYDDKLTQFIFNLIYKFANYGFNKSHSVVYALVAYQLSYLKANYPTLFYTELLNSVIGDDTKTKRYIDECQKRQVKLEVPSINTSDVFYNIHEDLIRLPLSIIKGISRNIATTIVKNRSEQGIYKSYVDAVVRLSHLKLTEKQLEALIDAGTFDIYNLSRATMIENLKEVKQYASLITVKDSNENTIFNYGLVSEPELKMIPNIRKESLSKEFNVLGFYLSDYPTKSYKTKYQTDAIYQMVVSQKSYRVIVKVDRIKEHIAKDNKAMAFLHVSDDTGSMDAVMFSNIYSKFKDSLSIDDIALIKGSVKEEGSIVIQDFHIFES